VLRISFKYGPRSTVNGPHFSSSCLLPFRITYFVLRINWVACFRVLASRLVGAAYACSYSFILFCVLYIGILVIKYCLGFRDSCLGFLLNTVHCPLPTAYGPLFPTPDFRPRSGGGCYILLNIVGCILYLCELLNFY